MKRTAYFNDTKPGQTQLNWTETSRINTLLERLRITSQFGVASGFRVTVNALDATKIDVGVGEGLTGGYYPTSNLRGTNSGERVATNDGSYSVTASAQSLADYTLGTSNYVSLVYSEDSSEPLTERNFPFTSHYTKINDSFSASVLSVTNWNLLTAAQKQQRILVGIVVAQGPGVALTSANITQVTQPRTHPVATQPVNITGVTVNGVSGSTPLGTATLVFISASKSLRFTAPGDAPGTTVALSSSGEYTVYSSNAAYYTVVQVNYALLPVVDRSDSLTITSLYGRAIPIASAQDVAHRDMIGSGLVTERNAHGLTLGDLGTGTLSHAELFHTNGITYEAAGSTQLGGTIIPASDTVEIVNLGGTTNTFLIGGTEYELIAGYAAGLSGQVVFTGTVTSGDYLIYLDSNANLQNVLLASYAGGVDNVFFDANLWLYDMHNVTAGTGTLDWNATTGVLRYRSPADVGGAEYGPGQLINSLWGGTVSGFYKLYSGGLTDWVLVYVDGSLGVTASSSFTITKSESTTPDDSMLKLCVVTWRADTGNLVVGSLRDIRQFMTADDSSALLEEHDSAGGHTKELKNQLRVGVANNAFQAVAGTSSAIYGLAKAGSIGVLASAPTRALVASGGSAAYLSAATAGHFVATNSGDASWAVGVGATAANASSPAYALAVDGEVVGGGATGVLGRNLGGSGGFGGVFLANSGTAAHVSGYFRGAHVTGGAAAYGAGVYGLVGWALNNINDPSSVAVGLWGRGVNAGNGVYEVGVYGSAANGTGVYAAGSVTGLGARAAGTGVYGSGGVYGVYGYGNANYGVWGGAPGYGVVGSAGADVGAYGYAGGNIGVSGSCAGNYGVAGAAAGNYGVYGYAAGNYGVQGSCAVDWGVLGVANRFYGVFGIASANYGGVFSATNNTNAYGVAAVTGLVAYAHATPGGGNFVVGGNFYAGNVAVAGNAIGVSCDMGLVATGALIKAHTAIAASGTANGNYDAYGIYIDAANAGFPARAIGVRAGVGGAGATAIFGYHNASGTAVVGLAPAANGTGVFGGGSALGVVAYGSVGGIYATADHYGGYFYGVNGANGIGASCVGNSLGIEAIGNATGIYARANVSYGGAFAGVNPYADVYCYHGSDGAGANGIAAIWFNQSAGTDPGATYKLVHVVVANTDCYLRCYYAP